MKATKRILILIALSLSSFLFLSTPVLAGGPEEPPPEPVPMPLNFFIGGGIGTGVIDEFHSNDSDDYHFAGTIKGGMFLIPNLGVETGFMFMGDNKRRPNTRENWLWYIGPNVYLPIWRNLSIFGTLGLAVVHSNNIRFEGSKVSPLAGGGLSYLILPWLSADWGLWWVRERSEYRTPNWVLSTIGFSFHF